MNTVKIMNEYLHGPIWVYNSDGIIVWRFPLISNDLILDELNKRAMEMYSRYYEFDSNDQPCRFNYEKEAAEKGEMLEIIGRINARLNEINDGSFIVEDLETPRLESI